MSLWIYGRLNMETSESKLNVDQKRIAILAELSKGAKAAELAERYDVNPMTIGSWRRKARLEAEKADVLEIEEIPPETIKAVVQEVREKAESSDISKAQYKKLTKELNKIEEGIPSLQLLDTAFHQTMLNLLTFANNQINDDMKISDWRSLVEGISQLHKELFGKDSINNVNIVQANNTNVNPSTAEFKSGFRS